MESGHISFEVKTLGLMKRIYIFNIYEGGIMDQVIFTTNQVRAKILKTEIHEFQKLEINLRPVLVKMSA